MTFITINFRMTKGLSVTLVSMLFTAPVWAAGNNPNGAVTPKFSRPGYLASNSGRENTSARSVALIYSVYFQGSDSGSMEDDPAKWPDPVPTTSAETLIYTGGMVPRQGMAGSSVKLGVRYKSTVSKDRGAYQINSRKFKYYVKVVGSASLGSYSMFSVPEARVRFRVNGPNMPVAHDFDVEAKVEPSPVVASLGFGLSVDDVGGDVGLEAPISFGDGTAWFSYDQKNLIWRDNNQRSNHVRGSEDPLEFDLQIQVRAWTHREGVTRGFTEAKGIVAYGTNTGTQQFKKEDAYNFVAKR